MKECPDEGRLQSFFDGELPADLMEETSRHVASCVACTHAAREIESENTIFLSALEPEMSAAVPTEQLRARITGAIAEIGAPRAVVAESSAKIPWLSSLAELFRLTPQRATAFASVLAVIVLGSIFAAVKLRSEPEAAKPSPIANLTPPQAGPTVSPVDPSPGTSPDIPSPPPNRIPRQSGRAGLDHQGRVRLIPGEESYLRTIADLDVGLNDGHRAMSPTTRSEYERNLKLVDNAIAATRSKAKRNPHDPDAAEFMFAAYQSKIDLLSTMTETARLTSR